MQATLAEEEMMMADRFSLASTRAGPQQSVQDAEVQARLIPVLSESTHAH